MWSYYASFIRKCCYKGVIFLWSYYASVISKFCYTGVIFFFNIGLYLLDNLYRIKALSLRHNALFLNGLLTIPSLISCHTGVVWIFLNSEKLMGPIKPISLNYLEPSVFTRHRRYETIFLCRIYIYYCKLMI